MSGNLYWLAQMRIFESDAAAAIACEDDSRRGYGPTFRQGLASMRQHGGFVAQFSTGPATCGMTIAVMTMPGGFVGLGIVANDVKPVTLQQARTACEAWERGPTYRGDLMQAICPVAACARLGALFTVDTDSDDSDDSDVKLAGHWLRVHTGEGAA